MESKRAAKAASPVAGRAWSDWNSHKGKNPLVRGLALQNSRALHPFGAAVRPCGDRFIAGAYAKSVASQGIDVQIGLDPGTLERQIVINCIFAIYAIVIGLHNKRRGSLFGHANFG